MGFVHNDLKLENILIGKHDPQNMYLIDFGLSCSFYEDDGKTHKEKKFINNFSGNIMFASLNSCRGNTKSRRDDIQSVFYIMISLLNDNTLPWDKLYRNYKKRGEVFKDYLMSRLNIKYSKMVYKMIDADLRPIFKKAFTLTFEEEPPYDEIISILHRKIQQVNDYNTKPHVFEWVEDDQTAQPDSKQN
jgi:serine/threonine protein kinase